MLVSFDSGRWCLVASWLGLAGDELSKQFIFSSLSKFPEWARWVKIWNSSPYPRSSVTIQNPLVYQVFSPSTWLPSEQPCRMSLAAFPLIPFLFVPYYPLNLRPRAHPTLLLDNVTWAGWKTRLSSLFFSRAGTNPKTTPLFFISGQKYLRWWVYRWVPRCQANPGTHSIGWAWTSWFGTHGRRISAWITSPLQGSWRNHALYPRMCKSKNIFKNQFWKALFFHPAPWPARTQRDSAIYIYIDTYIHLCVSVLKSSTDASNDVKKYLV